MLKESLDLFQMIFFLLPIGALLAVFYSIHFVILKKRHFPSLALKRAFRIALIVSFLISAVLVGALTYSSLADRVLVVFLLAVLLTAILFYLILAVYVLLDRWGDKKISLAFTFIAVACLFFAPFMAVCTARVAYFSQRVRTTADVNYLQSVASTDMIHSALVRRSFSLNPQTPDSILKQLIECNALWGDTSVDAIEHPNFSTESLRMVISLCSGGYAPHILKNPSITLEELWMVARQQPSYTPEYYRRNVLLPLMQHPLATPELIDWIKINHP